MTDDFNLIEKAKRQGYLEYFDIIKHLPHEISDKQQIEDIIKMIEDMGIEVRMTKAEVIKLFDEKN